MQYFNFNADDTQNYTAPKLKTYRTFQLASLELKNRLEVEGYQHL